MNQKRVSKTAIIIIVAIVILAVAWYFTNQRLVSKPLQDKPITIRGKVVEVDAEPLTRDGDGKLLLRGENGEKITVLIPARETSCKSKGALDIFHLLQLDDTVEAFGLGNKKVVRICDSSGHYLKIVDEDTTSTWKTYRNEKYGFEVRYPEKGLVKETDLVYDAPFMKLIVSFYENELKEESYKPIVEIFVRDDNFDINTLPDLQPYKLGGMDARIRINNKSEKLSTPLGGADILTYKNKSGYWYLIRTTENPLLENKISTSILSTFKFI